MSGVLTVVIPAKAGIHMRHGCDLIASAVLMDSRLRGNDGAFGAVEAQKLLGISLEGSVG